MTSADPLSFLDTKKYSDRLIETEKKTGLKDAMRTAHGTVDGNDLGSGMHGFYIHWRFNGISSRGEDSPRH